MNNKINFGFLVKRIDRPNIETAFSQLLADKNFVDTPQGDDMKRDSILLKFEQRVWEYNIDKNHDNIHVFNSFHGSDEVSDQYFMHDRYYQDASNSTLSTSFSCLPTLSFRTLLIHDLLHVKFGLPIYFGNMVRLYPIREAMVSMYISDCIAEVPRIEILDFFFIRKCYYYNNHSDFSVAHRSKPSKAVAIPFGNYFNKVLYFENKEVTQRFDDALMLVKNFLIDYNLMVHYLLQIGLGLEIHGQNLLVYVDCKGNSIRRYLYRDYGQCTISDDLFTKSKCINDFYQKKHDFDFISTGQIASSKVCLWQCFRTFILGFLFYNLDRYRRVNNIEFDVFKWGNDIIEKCDSLANTY